MDTNHLFFFFPQTNAVIEDTQPWMTRIDNQVKTHSGAQPVAPSRPANGIMYFVNMARADMICPTVATIRNAFQPDS